MQHASKNLMNVFCSKLLNFVKPFYLNARFMFVKILQHVVGNISFVYLPKGKSFSFKFFNIILAVPFFKFVRFMQHVAGNGFLIFF